MRPETIIGGAAVAMLESAGFAIVPIVPTEAMLEELARIGDGPLISGAEVWGYMLGALTSDNGTSKIESQPVTTVLNDFKAMADENEQLRDALTALFDLCMVHAVPGAFNNGVTDSTGTIDEGEVYASGVFDQARAALNIHKRPE